MDQRTANETCPGSGARATGVATCLLGYPGDQGQVENHVGYVLDKGRFTQAVLRHIVTELNDPSAALPLALLDLDIAQTVAPISRALVPDLPDRVIAATALQRQLPLVSRDRPIQVSGVPTMW